MVYNLAKLRVNYGTNFYCEHNGQLCYNKNRHYYFTKVEVSTAVMAEFYLSEYLNKSQLKFQIPSPQPVQLNPFCSMQTLNKPLYFPMQHHVDFFDKIKTLTEESLHVRIDQAYLRVNVTDSIRDITDLFQDEAPSAIHSNRFVSLLARYINTNGMQPGKELCNSLCVLVS